MNAFGVSLIISFLCNCDSKFVRLVDGPNEFEGRLEVYHSGIWGTVCDDTFNNLAARVTCQQIGYKHGQVLTYAGHHTSSIPKGDGPIWIDDISCDGTETSIDMCMTKNWGDHDCRHSEDVILKCTPSSNIHFIRLADGPDKLTGRLEVKHAGWWGTVCDDKFSNKAAAVACKQMGHRSGKVWSMEQSGRAALFGSGRIWMDDIICHGEESSLDRCMTRGWGQHNCVHREDVILECSPEIRTVGQNGLNVGRLEIKYDSIWGSICPNSFDNSAAKVACMEMGFNSGVYEPHTVPGQSGSII